MNILIVEDDLVTSEFIAKGLRECGFTTQIASCGARGLELAISGDFDLAIVDLNLPSLDGLSLVASMRSRKIHTPVLILTSKRSVDERVTGLQAGGDDYLPKPFAFVELLARVQALLRRPATTSDTSVLSSDGITMNLRTREVNRENIKLDLHPKEFLLLEYFMRNPGRVISKTQILDRIWSYSFDPQTNVVEVLVSRLRNKLDRDFNSKTIQTVRSVGYVFKAQ